MRKKQKREFLKKITRPVGLIVDIFIDDRGWTHREIAEASGVSVQRLSEMKNPETYNRYISEPDLARLMRSRLMSVSEISRFINLSRDESKYLAGLTRTHGGRSL